MIWLNELQEVRGCESRMAAMSGVHLGGCVQPEARLFRDRLRAKAKPWSAGDFPAVAIT